MLGPEANPIKLFFLLRNISSVLLTSVIENVNHHHKMFDSYDAFSFNCYFLHLKWGLPSEEPLKSLL